MRRDESGSTVPADLTRLRSRPIAVLVTVQQVFLGVGCFFGGVSAVVFPFFYGSSGTAGLYGPLAYAFATVELFILLEWSTRRWARRSTHGTIVLTAVELGIAACLAAPWMMPPPKDVEKWLLIALLLAFPVVTVIYAVQTDRARRPR